MNRKADAAGSKSTSSHPRRPRRDSQIALPRPLPTDYWTTSRRRSLRATLFAREKSTTSRRTRLSPRSINDVEGLEDRRLLANFSIAGGNLNLDLSDLN